MPPRDKVTALPVAVRDWLEKSLVAGNFSGYELLAAELKKRGYDIGKSSLHRHGEKIERRLAAIKASTEAAQLIVASSEDSEDARSEALISLTQHGLFEALVSLKDAETEQGQEERLALLSKSAKGIADVVRASISRKKFASDVRKAAQADAAKAVDAVAATKGSGLSAETADAIKRAILGVGQ